MSTSDSGNNWLSHYIDFFSSHYNKEWTYSIISNSMLDVAGVDRHLYTLMQSTGLIYGTPVRLTNADLPTHLPADSEDRVKMVLVDCLVHCSMAINKSGIYTASEVNAQLNDIFNNISTFYTQVFPRLKFDGINAIDAIIEKRVSFSKKGNDNFWSNYFQYSLLFLDIIYFSKWIKSEDYQLLLNEKEDVYFLIIKIIAASANANSYIEKEEELLFKNFLSTAKLKDENVKMANDYFFKGISLDSIDFDTVNSWIIKKYLLEIAILTIWADRVLDSIEKKFLIDLSEKLDFTESELNHSLVTIESFMLAHWHQIPYLSRQNDSYELLYNQLSTRIEEVVNNNTYTLFKDINTNDEYIKLLEKLHSGKPITVSESENLQMFTMKLIKDVPSLAVFLMPGGTTLLPILFKNIAKNITKAV